MARVQDLLDRKDSPVWIIQPEATVLAAARLMNRHRIGALVVESEGHICGIFTERDILRRVVAVGRDPAETPVSAVMTSKVVCCTPDTDTNEAAGAMRNRRIRHLPVADECGKLLGIVSIGDLNAQAQVAQEQTLFQLQEYISGRV